MDDTSIIIKPLVTEKSTHQQESQNTYAFKVDPNANKHQIKRAVERLYNVQVDSVRTMNRHGKPRRGRVRMTKTSDWKRAVVVLNENSRIDLF